MDFIVTMAMISGSSIPTGSGVTLSLREIADELAARLTRLFLRGPDGRRRRPSARRRCSRTIRISATTCCSHEFFHGDTGQGLGASHQTGWTGLVALLLHGTRGGRSDADGHADGGGSAWIHAGGAAMRCFKSGFRGARRLPPIVPGGCG